MPSAVHATLVRWVASKMYVVGLENRTNGRHIRFVAILCILGLVVRCRRCNHKQIKGWTSSLHSICTRASSEELNTRQRLWSWDLSPVQRKASPSSIGGMRCRHAAISAEGFLHDSGLMGKLEHSEPIFGRFIQHML